MACRSAGVGLTRDFLIRSMERCALPGAGRCIRREKKPQAISAAGQRFIVALTYDLVSVA